jgi:hypothetical protein
MSREGKVTGKNKNNNNKQQHKNRSRTTSTQRVKVHVDVDNGNNHNIELIIAPLYKIARKTQDGEEQKRASWTKQIRTAISHVIAIMLSAMSWKISS